MPTAPDAVLAAAPPSNTPTAPGNAAGSGAVSAPVAPDSIQAGGQPGAPSAPDDAAGAGGVSEPNGGTMASVSLDPGAWDSSVIFTAVEGGAAGNDITVAYAAPADQVTTTVAVVDDAIIVTPGTKARMLVAGTLTTDGSTPLVLSPQRYAGQVSTKVSYSDIGEGGGLSSTIIDWNFFPARWRIKSQFTVYFESSDYVTSPELVTTWTPVGAATGVPVVTAGISSAAQVIAAVNADLDAAALVTASANDTVTGAVAELAATNLTGGVDASITAPESIQAGGQPSAPSAPGNAAGSGTVSTPTAPVSIQASGQPSAPTAPAAVQS